MKELLRKLKLIDSFTTNLNIDKTDFVHRLSSITDEANIGLFSGTFDVFSSSKNEFKGQVDYNGFKLKRRKRFFDTNMNMAVANGTLSNDNGQLTISTEILGFNSFFIVFYIFLIIFYSVFIFGFMSSKDHFELFAIPFFLVHATLMFSIPYFVMRRSVKRLKYELEREFYYLTKNK